MANFIKLYVLTTLVIEEKGEVNNKNVGVTFDIFQAQTHRAQGFENEFETFCVDNDWQDDAAQSSLISAMRDFRDMVAEMQQAALR